MKEEENYDFIKEEDNNNNKDNISNISNNNDPNNINSKNNENDKSNNSNKEESPRYIEACNRLGIDPIDLKHISFEEYTKRNIDDIRNLPRNIQVYRYNELETYKKHLQEEVKEEREKIKEEQIKDNEKESKTNSKTNIKKKTTRK